MARVWLRFPAAASHARTARMVAAAAARRLDAGEGRTEAVRQAVGEACTYVLTRVADLPGAAIELTLDDDPAPGPGAIEQLVVDVRAVASSPSGGARAVTGGDPDDLTMVILSGLTDRLDDLGGTDGLPGLRLVWWFAGGRP